MSIKQSELLKVSAWPVEKVVPYARNPRKNEGIPVAKVKASLKEFGWRQPIVVDAEGVIIVGHTRYQAALELGMNEVPVHVAEGLTAAQVKAYRIADNKTGDFAEWDDDLLKLEFADLAEMDFDLDLTGFDGAELGGIMVDATPEGLTDPDEVPDAPAEPVTVRGDVWVMGNHRLMCGDSTSVTDVDILMAGKRANICFTSPPYNAGSINQKGNKATGKKYNAFDDNQTPDEFFDFLAANMGCMLSVADEVFYNIGLVQDNKRTIFKIVDTFGESFKDIIYWKKKFVAPHIQKGVINNLVEFILCFGDGKRKFLNPQFGQGTYWNVIDGIGASRNEFAEIHKATFPVYLPENIITNFTSRNAIVVDCFGGTGTTLIACEMTSRDCRMMELDPIYCDVIVKRWEDFTGKKAVLEGSNAEA